MARLNALLIALVVCSVTINQTIVDAWTDGDLVDFTFSGGADVSTVAPNGRDFQLVLDNSTAGSGVFSKQSYLYGRVDMQIKLVPGNSAGTATTYYMASPFGSDRDEIDFEFLGNVSGQPYICHTNIFANGNGDKEQQFYLWFDPTLSYHTYSFLWTPYEIVWLVDYIPIRVFRNYQNEGIPFPTQRGMNIKASIWNADKWATRGGLDKIDWNSSPFIASFQGYTANGCNWYGSGSISQCNTYSSANWWTDGKYKQLTATQLGQLYWVRSRYLIYDYCKDYQRFDGTIPPECYLAQF